MPKATTVAATDGWSYMGWTICQIVALTAVRMVFSCPLGAWSGEFFLVVGGVWLGEGTAAKEHLDDLTGG